MNDKIRVVHHSKSIGYSGTDRSAQLMCKYLKQREDCPYEPFLVYRVDPQHPDAGKERLEIVKEWLGEDHVIPYHWVPGKQTHQSPFMPAEDNLYEVLAEIDPVIVHLHRSGYAEWPGFRYMAPRAKFVETNIFGYVDQSPERQIDLNIYISEFIARLASKAGSPDGGILYNPIEIPARDMTEANKLFCRNRLINRFNLPQDAIILGRVGRADNFDPISLNAFKRVQEEFTNAYYLVVNPCDHWRRHTDRLGLKNVRFLDPIVDDLELSDFYRGLDIYAHARSDGECCPCNIQEAMMHNIPVVSHESAAFNGQSEIIGDGGFCVPIGDAQNYAEVLIGLCANEPIADIDEVVKPIREVFGRQARRRAMRYFEASYVVYKLIQMYDYVMEKK
jgi:glycosyltransferase involved in cell wall biosynthesis